MEKKKDHEYLTATELGKLFNLSAQAINSHLEAMNLRDPKTKEPTFQAFGLFKSVVKPKFTTYVWHRETVSKLLYEHLNKASAK